LVFPFKSSHKLGLVTPLGSDVKTSWESLVAGNSGIRDLKSIARYKDDPTLPDCTIAAVHDSFDPSKWQVSVRVLISEKY
jgi:3-oxoacyl-(acyl-carrier-protein) synthase